MAHSDFWCIIDVSFSQVFRRFFFNIHMLHNAQIPNWLGSEQDGSTKDNPFPLPDEYLASQQRNVCPLPNIAPTKVLNVLAPLTQFSVFFLFLFYF